MDFVQAPDHPAPLAAVLAGEALLFSFVGADPRYVPSYRARTVEDDRRVVVSLEEEGGHQGFRTLAGHRRWARAQLTAAVGGRRLVGDDDRLLPVVRAEALLRLPDGWSLRGYEYGRVEGGKPYWHSIFGGAGRTVTVAQGGRDLLHVDWQRDFFRPLRLDEPEVGKRRAVLYTFDGEEGTNHVLGWPTDTGAVSVQLLGPAEPAELVELARQVTAASSG